MIPSRPVWISGLLIGPFEYVTQIFFSDWLRTASTPPPPPPSPPSSLLLQMHFDRVIQIRVVLLPTEDSIHIWLATLVEWESSYHCANRDSVVLTSSLNLFPDLFTATLRILRHVVGVSAHAVCVAVLASNAYDVSVTAELLWRPAQVRASSWGMGKISMRSPRYSSRVSDL